jgi:N-acetylglutamate synthase-like GNAT family acetyltransferase
MKIRKATKKDFNEELKIAESLKEWFNEEGIKSMRIDLKINKTIVAEENEKIVGFLSYISEGGFIKINWIGVTKNFQRKGIGGRMINWLEKDARNLKARAIQVETLTDKEEYEPYQKTRNFYYKMGFKKIKELPEKRPGWDIQILLEKDLI